MNLVPSPEKWQSMLEVSRRAPALEVARTPREVIWTKNKSRLYRYFPTRPVETRPAAVRPPLLLTYALINRPYVMDLYPGRSMIEYLVNRGFEVYLLDWTDWGPEDRGVGFDHLVYDYLRPAARRVMRHAGSEDFHLLGYCMGGTINLLYAALHPGPEIRSLILMTTPVDFTDYGLFSLWLSDENFALDKMVQTMGNIPPEIIDFGNKMLKPVANFISPPLSLYERIEDSSFVRHFIALNQWVNDGIPFPGEAFRQWIQDFLRDNRLARGELVLRGNRVDLGRITCPLLTVVGNQDHIVPPKQTRPVIDLVGSRKKEYCPVKSGHIGLITGPAGPKEVYPLLENWLVENGPAD